MYLCQGTQIELRDSWDCIYWGSCEVVLRRLNKEVDGLRKGFTRGYSLDCVEDSDSDGSCNEDRVGYSILGMCTISSFNCCVIVLKEVGCL